MVWVYCVILARRLSRDLVFSSVKWDKHSVHLPERNEWIK